MTTRFTKLSLTPIKQSFLFAVFLMISMVSYAQLSVDAGKDTTYCVSAWFKPMILGADVQVENGTPPYTFAWEYYQKISDKFIVTASDYLNDTSLQSPLIISYLSWPEWRKFILHVTDANGNYAKDSIYIRLSLFVYLTGGGQERFYIEKGDSILLRFPNSGVGGGIEPLTYYWQPKTYLSDPDSVVTWCKPDSSVQYEAFAIDSCGCVSESVMAYDIRILPENPSHDYQTVHSNRVALFVNSDNRIKGLRIDSIKVEKDSVFYPFAVIQEVSPDGRFSPFKASWIGEKVVVKPDGTNLFFNREGDTITLKTRARINETWIAFQRTDTLRVEASVQAIELGNVPGLSDSVKTIVFRVLDQQGNIVNHVLNKLKVKISKTYGFVETLNFYLFPDILIRYQYTRLEAYTLVGLTNPKVGIQNLTWFEVNDFQPGDELHVQEHKTGDSYLSLPIREYDNQCIYKYLERIDYADSIIYRYARRQSIETVYTDSATLEIFNDTLKSVVKANPDFDKLPGEPIFDTYTVHSIGMINDELRTKAVPNNIETYTKVDSFLALLVGEGCLYEEKYIDGLGGPYYYCYGYMGDTEERKIVYYKKGETEWGEKLVITGVSEIKTSNDLKVFPNPADAYITISNPSNIKIKKIEMFDFSGRVVQQWKAHELEGNQLNIQHILSGIYLLKTETNAGVKTEKLVIQ
jgi:hypothetical protein